jgi:uncharacterized protein YbaR (Trm112 family)
MYQFVDGKDKHVFGRFTTGTLVNPKEHASFIIMDGVPVLSPAQCLLMTHQTPILATRSFCYIRALRQSGEKHTLGFPYKMTIVNKSVCYVWRGDDRTTPKKIH